MVICRFALEIATHPRTFTIFVRSDGMSESGMTQNTGLWGAAWSRSGQKSDSTAYSLGFGWSSGITESYNYNYRYDGFPLRCLVR